MAEPIDTYVMGDREAMTSAANWIKSVGTALDAMGDHGQNAVTASEPIWGGQTGPAFRDTMGVNVAAAHDASGHTTTVGDALQTLREELDTVHSRMGQARDVARAAGLTIDGDFIMPPGDPPAEPGDDASEAEQTAYTDAVDQHNARVKAFNECVDTAIDARDIERLAHQAFETAAQLFADGMQAVQSTISTVASHAHSFLYGAGAANFWYLSRFKAAEGVFADAARRWHSRATLARQQLVDAPPRSPKGQRALLNRIDRYEARTLHYHQLSQSAHRLTHSRWSRYGIFSGRNRLLSGLQQGLSYAVAQHLPTHRPPTKHRLGGQRIPGLAGETVRRGLMKVSGPVAVLGTAYGVYSDVQNGMAWQEASLKGGTTLAAGVAAGGLAQAGVAALAVPGAGWAIGAGILVGTGATLLVSENWDTISNAAEDVGGMIADGAEAVVDGAGAVVDKLTFW